MIDLEKALDQYVNDCIIHHEEYYPNEKLLESTVLDAFNVNDFLDQYCDRSYRESISKEAIKSAIKRNLGFYNWLNYDILVDEDGDKMSFESYTSELDACDLMDLLESAFKAGVNK